MPQEKDSKRNTFKEMKAYYIQALMKSIGTFNSFVENIESIGNDGRVPILKSAIRFKTPRKRPITRNKRKHIKT